MAPTAPTITEAEAATYLGVSLATLRRWRRKGEGPTHERLGVRVRYQVADLDQFRADRRKAAAPAQGAA